LSTIQSRVRDNHINGNTGSSTFRFVLASLLVSSLDLHPYPCGKDFVLSSSDNARLRHWRFKQLRLTWCERAQPCEIEQAVIQAMQPPLNTAGNAGHSLYATVRASRAAFRAAALQGSISVGDSEANAEPFL
jgi:hypothetical protein